MGTLYQQVLEDITEISTELGSPVISWNGVDYECVPSTAHDSKEVDMGGLSLTSDLTVSIRINLFCSAVYPEPQKSKIKYLNHWYRVIHVRLLNNGAVIRLVCVNENRLK
jgi:hypothetical protein